MRPLTLWLERGFCAFAVASIPFVAGLQLLHILPHYYGPDEPIYWLHALAGASLFVSVSLNLYRLITVDPSTRGRLVDSAEVTPAWRFCATCECHSPPRSHHCETCNICVLRRDHHCVFARNCVGLANQRYYLLTVVSFALAAHYAALFNWRFVLAAHDPLSVKSAFQLLLPFLAMCLGVSSFYQFVLAFTLAVCSLSGCLLWVLFFFHARLVLANQTTYERARRIEDYNVGWRANSAQVLGPRGWLSLVGPFACLATRPTVDGFKYPMAPGFDSGEGPRKTM